MNNKRLVLYPALALLILINLHFVQGARQKIPNNKSKPDWLIDNSSFKSKVEVDEQKKELTLTNGLVRRVFRLAPNAATVGFDNLVTG